MGRRTRFWFAVAGVSVLSQFALEALAEKVPSPGLARFVAFIHRGSEH